MYNLLHNIDKAFFVFFNQTLSNPFFDKFFPFITDVKNWYIAFIILWLIAIFKGGRIGKISAVGIIFVIITSDQISSHILKPLFERIRPCNFLQNVHLLVACSKSYSMPSSHATNNFAAAVFFSRLFPKFRIPFFVVATLIALSRVIVGVHYFSDILAGALLGSLIGYLFSLAAVKFDYYIENKRKKIR